MRDLLLFLSPIHFCYKGLRLVVRRGMIAIVLYEKEPFNLSFILFDLYLALARSRLTPLLAN